MSVRVSNWDSQEPEPGSIDCLPGLASEGLTSSVSLELARVPENVLTLKIRKLSLLIIYVYMCVFM